MNQLVANPETGFLESFSPTLQTFDSEKKLQFLQAIQDHVKETQKWPDMGSVCDAVGISTKTFERHLVNDAVFADAYRSVTLRGKYKLESIMFDLSTKNPMYMFGWLRKYFPAEYNPDHKVSVEHNINVLQNLIVKSREVSESIDTQAL